MSRVNSIFYKRVTNILLFFIAIFLNAQNKPGNTSLDVELWLKADQLSLSNGTNVTSWNDQSGKNRNFSQNGTNNVPTFTLNGMNYNPALNFGTTTNTKLVGPVNINNTLKEYYVFIVSYNRSTSWAMMLTFNQQRNNGYGWANTVTSPWQFTGYNRVAANGATERYNVSSAYVPNASGLSAYQYVNGVETIFGANTSQAFPTSTTNRMVIGAADLGTSYNFTGDISEIIVLSKNKTGTPDYNELSKVNTYLALKYGITLTQNNQVNYFNSVGNVIWNRTNNIGYENHIFGIGKDDQSNLNIKQSTSYSNNDITLYRGSLQDLNKNNTATITTNNSYLILGSNNLQSTRFYKYEAGTTFSDNVTLPKPIYKRFNRIYKASNTNFTDNVNIKLANNLANATYLLVSNTNTFAPADTRIYEINNGVVEGITINNNDFISFVSPEKAPGGTDLTVELWLNPNNLSFSDNSNITAWGDESYFQRNFIQNGTNPVPTMNYNGMNFNPALKFGTATNTKLVGPVNIIDPNKEYYIFYVSKTDRTGTSGDQTVLAFNQDYHNSYGWQGSKPWFYTNTANTTSTYNVGIQYSINAAFLPNQGVNTLKNNLYVNGFLANQSNGYLLLTSTSNLMTIGTYNTGTGNNFTGDINEIIVLSKTKNTGLPNTSEIQKINSYLAIKYGITLDTSEQPDYYDSEGNIIWDGSENIDYQNAIFGIGRDDFGGLNQKQSTSTETSAFTLFVGTLADLNKNNNTGTFPENNSFIIVGSNNQNGTTLYDPIGTYENGTTISNSDVSRRYNRILKVNKTGTIGPVNIKLSNQFSYAPYVIVSNTTTFEKNATRIYPVVNGVAQGITLNHNDYIGFLSPRLIPGGTNLETELWLRADFLSGNDNQNINTWYDISNYSRNVSQNGTNDTPLFLNSSLNYNPSLRFGSTSSGTPSTSTKLVGDAFGSNDKSFYVFYVANNENTNTSTATSNYGATFSFRGNSNDWSTGISNAQNWMITGANFFPSNSNYTTPNTTKYMVSTAYFTTSSTAVDKPSMFTNGHRVTFTGNNYNYAAGSNPKTVIGAQQVGSDYHFIGTISEMIVLSSSNNEAIKVDQVQKVNSYLALKYGITLDPTSHPNYYNSMNQSVWSNTDNSEYQKDLITLGRDDTTGFYQKQATSANQNSVTIYLNELANSNTENSSVINDNLSYLILGSNGKDEFINYNNTGLNSEIIYQRSSRTLKVKSTVNGLSNNSNNTGINTVNFKLANELYYSSYIIVSNSENFDSGSSTRLYPVVNGIADKVQLHDGEFVSFIPEDLTPGALSGFKREFWLNADKINPSNIIETGIETTNLEVTYWNNLADNSNNFYNTGTTKAYYPVFNKTSMNYHSSVDFSVIDTVYSDPVEIVNRNQNEARKLISEKDFTRDATRSYFVVSISKLNPDEPTNEDEKSVFALNNTNYFGWIGTSNQYPWFHIGTDKNQAFPSPPQVTEKRIYGITINQLPNTTSGLYLALNGLQNNQISGTSTLGAGTSKSVIGNYSYNATGLFEGDNFFGEVLEILVLSKPGVGQSLTANELEKINTFYALKYGVSLNTGGQNSYKIPTNTADLEIYNSTTYAPYNKDIFGIVRNDISGLYQKQAISTDNPIMLIYQGNPAETNNENTSNDLQDNQAVILGATGDIRNIIEYRQEPGTQFANYKIPTEPTIDPDTRVEKYERLSNRFSYTLRAWVTTNQSSRTITVNLAPNLGQYLLVSKTADFTPGQTDIYPIKGNVVEGVEITHGDYIGFALYMEAPGGVARSLRMWLNASEQQTITTNNLNEILTWSDYSGYGTTYKKRIENKASALYVKADEKTNFHPTALFRKWQDYLITDRAPMFEASPLKSTVYSVVNHNFATSRSYFIGFGAHKVSTNARRPSFGVYRYTADNYGNGRGRIGSTGLTNSNRNLFKTGSTTIAGFTWTLGSTIKFDFDANVDLVNHTYNRSLMNGPGMLGVASSSNNYYLQGTMPEVIAYEDELTDEERNNVNSYLGLKYAITLYSNRFSSPVTNFNYKFSNGESVWDGNDATRRKYHNNVASIIRDDDSKLYNKQAKSTIVGDIIHMGIGKSLGVDGDLGFITSNLSALTWGNNGESFTEHTFGENSNVCGPVEKRIGGRVWLATPTNFNQDVILRVDDGQIFPFSGAGYQVYLLVANSEEKLSIANNNWDQIIPMYYINGAHQVNYKFTENTYFTFGAKYIGSCASCEFEGEKQLSFTKQTWPVRGDKGPRTFNLNNNFNVQVTVDDPNNNLRNRYPRYSSKKSLRERRRGGNTVTTYVKFTDDQGQKTAAVTSFNLLDIDRAGYTLDDVQVIGYCNGSPVYPNVYYTYNRPERSRYLIKLNAKAEAKSPGTRYSGGSGYTNARAMAFVEFENSVDEVRIIYNTPSIRSTYSTQEIGIGEMNFYCITPPPPPNEDGLIFTKQATSSALLCETVNYTFRMINTNCSDKEVTFIDTLPLGMEWDLNSIIVLDPNYIIDPNNPIDPDLKQYDEAIVTTLPDGKQTLTITGLKIPGSGISYSVRASAVFSENATAGEYLNNASIKYNRIVNGIDTEVSLVSTDRLTGGEYSKTIASDSDRPKRVITEFNLDKSCFGLNKEIEATLKITNPNTNTNITDLMLDLGFSSEGISYIPGSINATGINLTISSTENTNNQANYVDLSDLQGGNISIENFNIAAESTITIKLKFQTSANLEDYIYPVNDPSTIPNPIPPNYLDPADIFFSYDLYSESDADCMDTTTTFTNGEIDLPFCTFCTQQPTGGTELLSSDTGISTLQNKFSNWPSKVPNGFLVLESGKKGMVITRTTPSKIANPVSGMIIYNTDSNCLSIYVEATNTWKCIERACND